MLSGVQLLPLEGIGGHFTVEQIKKVVRPADDHHPKTKLIALENTHNRSGGTIFPIEEMKKIREFSLSEGIKLHLDGARLWNAAIKTGISIQEYCNLFDSVSLCFSKGLGAPAGSIIVGSKEFIDKARYTRKAFGGGMRQVGILAAAALYALENNIDRLKEDHDRARKLGESLAEAASIDIDLNSLQTNIVLFDVKNSGMSGREFISKLADKDIKMLPVGETKIRAVTHLQITDSDIEKTINELQTIFFQN
jgi:threonine aldolase